MPTPTPCAASSALPGNSRTWGRVSERASLREEGTGMRHRALGGVGRLRYRWWSSCALLVLACSGMAARLGPPAWAASGLLLQTTPVGLQPIAVAIDGQTGLAIVAASDATSVLATATGQLLRRIPGGVGYDPYGASPHAVAVDVTRARAFVANFNRGYVSVIDTRTGALVRTIRVGAGPDALAVDEGSGYVFVANFGAGTVSMLDTRSGRVLRTIAVGHYPSALAVDPRTGEAFVANAGSNSVSIIDTHTRRLVGTVPVGQYPNAIAAAGGRVLVTNQQDNTVSVLASR